MDAVRSVRDTALILLRNARGLKLRKQGIDGRDRLFSGARRAVQYAGLSCGVSQLVRKDARYGLEIFDSAIDQSDGIGKHDSDLTFSGC